MPLTELIEFSGYNEIITQNTGASLHIMMTSMSGWYNNSMTVLSGYTNQMVSTGSITQGNTNITGEVSGNLGYLNSYGMGFKKLNQNINWNSTTLVDITGLDFPVDINRIYGFEAFIPFATNTATCGLTLAISGPNTNGATGYWSSEIMLTSGAGTDSYQSVVRDSRNALFSSHTTTSVGFINNTHIAKIMGSWITVNAPGTVQLRFAPEVNTNIATIMRGAWLRYF